MEQLSYLLYPRIYDITQLGSEDAEFGHTDEQTGYMVKPYALPLRNGKLNTRSLYLVDNGETLTILVNRSIKEELLLEFFGYRTT